MNCSQAQVSLQRVLDDRLDEREMQLLTAHLAGCTACREHQRVLQVTSSVLRGVGAAPVPPSLAADAFNVAMTRKPVYPSLLDLMFPWAWRMTLAGAAVATVLCVMAARAPSTAAVSTEDAWMGTNIDVTAGVLGLESKGDG